MSVIVVKEQVATLVVAQSLAGGGGGGGAVASVNGRTGVVVLDAADVGAEPAGTLAAHVAASDPHTQYQREDALRQIIRVSTRPEATDVRTGLGVYDDTRPFASVQAALTASAVGDTIVVEPGEYSMGATTLTNFNGRVIDLRDAVLSWSGTSASAVQVGDGQTLTIVGTGSLRLASSSFATVHALPGSTLHLRLREIRHLGNGAALVADGDMSLVADVVSSASYDALIFMGGRLHARIGRLGESGGSNAVAWEGVGVDATAFIEADEIIGDDLFSEEPDGASGAIWISARRVAGIAIGDGSAGTDPIRRWYLRADTLSLTDPDLSFVGPYFTLIDEQWERVSRRNAANGYAGLDSSSKIAGSQQRYGTTADTACEGNDARLNGAIIARASTLNQNVAVNLNGSSEANMATLISQSVTLAVGDIIEVELWGAYLNNSGASRTLTLMCGVGDFDTADTLVVAETASISASSTNRARVKIEFRITVASTSSCGFYLDMDRTAGAADSGGSTSTPQQALYVDSANITGAQTLKVKAYSTSTAATQTFTVYGWTIRRITA